MNSIRVFAAAILCIAHPAAWASVGAFLMLLNTFTGPPFVDRKPVAAAPVNPDGDYCVSGTAQMGDRVSIPGKGTAVVRSLSGTSRQCNEANPIRAFLEFMPDAAPVNSP